MTGKEIQIKSLDQYHIGDIATIFHKITEKDVEKFADLTGDYNPLHLDYDFALSTSFRKPVVYGMLSAAFISTLIGMEMPGPGALWTSQTLDFKQQVYIGDEIKITGVVKLISKSTRTMVIDIETTNQRGESVITGKATVKLLEPKKRENMDIKNDKVILISGGAKGVGAQIAIKAAQQGYVPVINYNNSFAEAKKIQDEIIAYGGKAYICKADVSKENEVQEMILRTQGEVGSIYAFVHCAAPNLNLKKFDELQWEDIQNQIEVQVKGAYNHAKILLPQMVSDSVPGKFIIIGSIASDSIPPVNQIDYVVAKAALSSLAKNLAVEYSPKGISITVVSPGMMETDRIINIPEKGKLLAKMQAPARSLIDTDTVADTVLFLLQNRTCAFTGETIRVCGGTIMI